MNFLHWLETHQLICPVKYFLHVDCPGCGLQRSCAALLKGDLLLSLTLHPATIPLVLFFAYAILHLVFRFKKGNRIIVASYLFLASLILTNYIYKII